MEKLFLVARGYNQELMEQNNFFAEQGVTIQTRKATPPGWISEDLGSYFHDNIELV